MHHWFWGMNFLWWIFWIAVVAVFFAVATPARRGQLRSPEDPLSILRRRYAAGELTTEEYEDRKGRLLKDIRDQPPDTGGQPPRIDQHQPA